MMLLNLLTSLLSVLLWPWHDTPATDARQEIYADLYRAAGSLYVYKEPRQEKSTPIPRGYTPVALQLFARNGSRYLMQKTDYEQPRQILQRAQAAGKLTALGREVLAEVDSLATLARGHYGEITRAGIEQHRGIARRMFYRHKEIFGRAKTIEVVSTPSLHCQQSMQSQCAQLLALNPHLQFSTDIASHSWFSGLISAHTTELTSVNPYRLMGCLFNDTIYIRQHIEACSLFQQLFLLAANIQSLDCRLDLFRIFTRDECYAYWRDDNYSIFRKYTRTPCFDAGKETTELLMSRIEQQAQKSFERQQPSAMLCFGNEENLLRLCEALNLNGCSLQAPTSEEVATHWRSYQLFPLGANLQLVFYRSRKNPRILVKVLLNERETRIPIPSDTAPYYDWEQVRLYVRQMLAKR